MVGGPTAWVTVRPASAKFRHVQRTPWTSLTHWDPAHATVMAECCARLETDPDERRRVWDAIAADDPPHGFDPATTSPGGPDAGDSGPLRTGAWRVELAGAHGGAPPPLLVWRPAAG